MQTKKSASRGEIALTLTVLSFALMLIGTALGGIQKQQTTASKAAESGSCYYKAKAKVVINGTKDFSASLNGGTGLWGIANNKAQTNEFFPSNTKSEYTYETNNLTFKPVPGAQYSKGELADVFLIGLNRDKWNVIGVHCKNNQTDKTIGCSQSNTKLNISPNGAISITNIKVDCNVDIEYDFEVAPKTPQSESIPTTRPTAEPTTRPGFPTATQAVRAQCMYSANAQVIKANQDPISFDENGGSVNFGVSNDQQLKKNAIVPAGKFGENNMDGKKSDAGRFAVYQYSNMYEHFIPDYPDAPYTHEAKPNGADVTLMGLGSDWVVTGTFCKPGYKAKYGNKGCPNITNQGYNAITFKGFKPDCDVSINYGWIVEPKQTPSQGRVSTPTGKPGIRISPSATPTAIPTFTPTPTSIVSIPPQRPTGVQNKQDHYDIVANEDATVDSNKTYGWNNQNFGKKETIIAGYFSESVSDKPFDRYAFLYFDISNLKNAKIKNAYITLVNRYCSGYANDPNRHNIEHIGVYQVAGNWSEDTITWTNMPEYNQNKISGFTVIDNCKDNIYKFSLRNSLVQSWIDTADKNMGLMLKDIDTPTEKAQNHFNSQIQFNSKDQSDPSVAPRLTIELEEPIAPSSPIPNNKPSTPKTPTKSPLARRDLNGDGAINVIDLVVTLGKLGTRGTNIPADFNKDGIVNAVDAASVIANFGKKVN